MKAPIVYDLAARHALPTVRVGRRLRFDPDALDAWLAALASDGPGRRGTLIVGGP